MKRPVKVTPEAKHDLSDAAHWYNDQKAGLGESFLIEVLSTLDAIEENPHQYPVIRKDTRRALVHRFPFAIFYVIDPDEIVVTAVLHGRRHPSRWQHR